MKIFKNKLRNSTKKDDVNYKRDQNINKLGAEIFADIISKLTLYNVSLQMRAKILLEIANAFENFDVDWSLVNRCLYDNLMKFDYNIHSDVFSIKSLQFLIDNIEYAKSSEIVPWMILKCVNCDNEFSMKYGEAMYFKQNNLIEPKHCKKCCEIRKRNQ